MGSEAGDRTVQQHARSATEGYMVAFVGTSTWSRPYWLRHHPLSLANRIPTILPRVSSPQHGVRQRRVRHHHSQLGGCQLATACGTETTNGKSSLSRMRFPLMHPASTLQQRTRFTIGHGCDDDHYHGGTCELDAVSSSQLCSSSSNGSTHSRTTATWNGNSTYAITPITPSPTQVGLGGRGPGGGGFEARYSSSFVFIANELGDTIPTQRSARRWWELGIRGGLQASTTE